MIRPHLALAALLLAAGPRSAAAQAPGPQDAGIQDAGIQDAGKQAGAPACTVPDEYSLPDAELPAVKRAVAAKRLSVLVIGGAASTGGAGVGAGYTYPARLQAQLSDQLPGVRVEVTTRAAPHSGAHATVARLGGDLEAVRPDLVIWGAGAREAGLGSEIEGFIDNLQAGVAAVRAVGADLILLDLQYAPSLVRVLNLAPYREAVLRVGEADNVPVLDRYELMRGWSDEGVLDLDATDPKERVQVARTLFDCLATALDQVIVRAARS